MAITAKFGFEIKCCCVQVWFLEDLSQTNGKIDMNIWDRAGMENNIYFYVPKKQKEIQTIGKTSETQNQHNNSISWKNGD